eukprot:gene42081-55855_t
MTLSMWHIILFLLAFTMAGILHISLSDCYFMAYLHIVLTHSKVIVIGAFRFMPYGSCLKLQPSVPRFLFLVNKILIMLAMLFYIVTGQVAKILLGSWAETGGDTLAGYIAVQIVCILLATVIPARFMRKVVQMSEQLKREFVRY